MGQERVILVTGGSGLAGRNLREYVEENPVETDRYVFVSSKEADLLDEESVRALFERIRPTHVIHLAAAVGGLFKNLQQSVQLFRHNVRMNDLILEYSRLHNVEKLVYCLSTCIFPDGAPYPLKESVIEMGAPHWSNEGYGYSKRMMHVLARCYNRQYKTKFVGICPCNLFGKYDNFNLQDGHVVASLIHRFYEADRKNEPFVVWGSGKPLRQFLSARDFARITIWALDNYEGGDGENFFICAPPEPDEVSIAELARIVAGTINPNRELAFDTSKSDGQYKKTASNEKFSKLHPSFVYTPLADSIRETTEWFIRNYDTARR